MLGNTLMKETPEEVYDWLMAGRRGKAVEEILAQMLASWSLGYGALPEYLGLTLVEFDKMLRHHFPGINPAALAMPERVRDVQRSDEVDELCKLLLDNRTRVGQSETWMAHIVAAGCMGSDHLCRTLVSGAARISPV